jgi:hypothetical protein
MEGGPIGPFSKNLGTIVEFEREIARHLRAPLPSVRRWCCTSNPWRGTRTIYMNPFLGRVKVRQRVNACGLAIHKNLQSLVRS